MENQIERISTLFKDIDLTAIFSALLIALGFILVYQALRLAMPRIAEFLPARARMVALNTVPAARLILTVLAVVTILPMIFNLTLENFVFLLSLIGVALGFALKDFATSAFAGFVSLFERPYRSGDWIAIGDSYGEVIEIGLRALKLRTANDDVVTIPHSRIWSDNIINSNNGDTALMCVARFLIDPRHPAPALRATLSDVALSSPYLDWGKPVKIVMHNEPMGTWVLIRAYPFEIRDQFDFITDLTERGRDALLGEGIRILAVPDLAAPGDRPA